MNGFVAALAWNSSTKVFENPVDIDSLIFWIDFLNNSDRPYFYIGRALPKHPFYRNSVSSLDLVSSVCLIWSVILIIAKSPVASAKEQICLVVIATPRRANYPIVAHHFPPHTNVTHDDLEHFLETKYLLEKTLLTGE